MKKIVSIIFLILAFFIIYFLQSNFFTWFNMAGVMPNLYIILILFIGLFAKRKVGLVLGIVFGLYIDIVLGKAVGISSLALGAIGLLGETLSKNFSKDSRFTIMLMVIGTTAIYEIAIYIFNIIKTEASLEILSFIKILVIEIFFNAILTIIIYPLMKKAGYKLENIFEDKVMLTRFFS